MEVVEVKFGNSLLTLETGRLAKQANGSILVRYGDTVVLVAVAADKKPMGNGSFLPLSVFYVEKGYASGRVPGGFLRREGRLSDHETIVSRLIDRSLRPLFHPNFCSETTVSATVLSYDQNHDPEVMAITAASAALMISDVPYVTPIAGIRLGYIEGEFCINPSKTQLTQSKINLIIVGARNGIVMVEGEAKEVSEEFLLEALMFGHKAIQPVIDLQEALVARCGKSKRNVVVPVTDHALVEQVRTVAEPRIKEALETKDKGLRYELVAGVVASTTASIYGDTVDAVQAASVEKIVGELKKDGMRRSILERNIRIDGRTTTEIRPISCETQLLPRAHGSRLFTRGETQVLSVITLGTKEDEQLIDSMTTGVSYKKFLLHYNFPGFSVGEAKPPRGPGRREIGHGFLAERGLSAVLPTTDAFPYTIRLVSEVLESNGSSSMATVCSGSLAMMDAGIPIKTAVAGIAMGLIYDNGKTAVLSDILGDEDHLGDMDFKVVGTAQGVTALQMDIKINEISEAVLRQALMQARQGLNHILGIMNEALPQTRTGLSSFAPRFVTHKIAKEKIGTVIGPGGKVIKNITETTGVKVNIDEDGFVHLSSKDHKAVDMALQMVKGLTQDVEIGAVYEGVVKKVADFGAFVEVFAGQDGLVHISRLTDGRVKDINDVIREGQVVRVKAIGFDKRGKLQLSIKDAETEA